MAYDRDDFSDLAFDTDRRLNRMDDRRFNPRRRPDRDDRGSDRQARESRRHGDPYGETFSRSLHEERPRPYRDPRDDRPPHRGSDRRGGYGNPRASGGYGSDRGGVTYGLSGAEGGFDEDEALFDAPGGFDPYGDVGAGAYGGQKGGLSAGYGRRESGLRRESAAVAGAFGGRRDLDPPDADRADMRGRGPKGYTRSDERIREAVCDALTDDPLLDAGDIEIEVAQGEVTLNGMVSARAAKRHAEDLVEQVSGVRHVQNNLRVHDGGDRGSLRR